jgi:hypothetical protein
LFAQQFHQVDRETDVSGAAEAGRYVAAQRHHPVDAEGDIAIDQSFDRAAVVGAHREVWRHFETGSGETGHGLERAVARRTAGAVGHRIEHGSIALERRGGFEQRCLAFVGLRREELEAEPEPP